MEGLLLKLEVHYPNFEIIKIPCITFKLSQDKRTLYVYTYYDRFISRIEIPKKSVIDVFLLRQHNTKVSLFY